MDPVAQVTKTIARRHDDPLACHLGFLSQAGSAHDGQESGNVRGGSRSGTDTVQLVWNAVHHAGEFSFGLQITLWLWFTVLFANFAEAMAEGRGKAQADTLRKARAETQAQRLAQGWQYRNSVPVRSSAPAT